MSEHEYSKDKLQCLSKKKGLKDDYNIKVVKNNSQGWTKTHHCCKTRQLPTQDW